MFRFVLASLSAGSAFLLFGCAGELDDPGAFSGDGGTEVKSAEMILAESCGTTGCHDNSSQAQAGLDLLSPGVENRVVDVNAIGIGCTSRILVVSGDPDDSYLIDKVLNVPGICGLQMPVVGNLPSNEIEVLRQWIVDLGSSSGAAPNEG
jgi:hypothetical protein